MKSRLTKQANDFSRWYTDVVLQAELADYSPVKGCMVIRPNGYALWEKIQSRLDAMFKESGHRNAYFPLFIPESFIAKEAEHVKGFAPECAVVTQGGGKKLEENLIIRPTSETIIYDMYAKWISSYRDLPVLINQWANVVRWEMRTRLFLRTTEFLWQEGHTAHATYDEAEEETLKILDIYAEFFEKYMAVPVLKGIKTDKEKFAGALRTYCVEAIMGDGKSLQVGTSHNLGDNFARAFDVRFQNRKGEMEYVWSTSWGVSTRSIGALIMVHGDDRGLRIPPRLASPQVVIVPIWQDDSQKSDILAAAGRLAADLRDGFEITLDDRDQYSPGWKFNDWELKGVPLRIELGPNDLRNNSAVLVRRDTGEKTSASLNDLKHDVGEMLEAVQKNLYEVAEKFRSDNTFRIDDYEEFTEKNGRVNGFYFLHWCGSPECEQRISDETKATIRLIPFKPEPDKGRCIRCGHEADYRVLFGKAY